MRKAVFLDRDGVINRELGHYVRHWGEFEFNPKVFEALRIMRAADYGLIIVTNQAGIAKGEYTHAKLEEIMSKALEALNEQGISVLEYYYSPHHPKFGQSLDRKPGSLMIEKGLARFNLNSRECYLIGDNDTDIEAAEGAGISPIKIDSNQNLLDIVGQIDGCD